MRKYQKFIELWGSPITKEDIEENKYAILRVFKEVKLYFEENPVYGSLSPMWSGPSDPAPNDPTNVQPNLK